MWYLPYLSQPIGTSVNEFILEEFCSVRYSVFDDAVKLARLAGESAMMAKIDIKHAFRLCPVRMVDRPLLCFQWETCILWIHVYLLGAEHLQQYLIHLLMPWLGFFSVGGALFGWFFMCAPNAMMCSQWMTIFKAIFSDIGVPISHEKTVGPSSQLTYLGIEIDTVARCVKLPQEKYISLMSLLKEWKGKRKCKKRELLSLIGPSRS